MSKAERYNITWNGQLVTTTEGVEIDPEGGEQEGVRTVRPDGIVDHKRNAQSPAYNITFDTDSLSYVWPRWDVLSDTKEEGVLGIYCESFAYNYLNTSVETVKMGIDVNGNNKLSVSCYSTHRVTVR